MVIIRYDTLHMRSWTVPAQCSADHNSGNPDRTKQAAVHKRSAHVGRYDVSSEVQVCRVEFPHGLS